jgi:putative DNA methylase
MTPKKKLIEVALPLDAINAASGREKSIRHGHPSSLHLWWARRPSAAARAVIFGQMVDDPSSHPEQFPTEEVQEAERQRLFLLIEELVLWENATNETVLKKACDEIWKSWRETCHANQDHPQAKELFDQEKLPAFHDPFAGGGTLPLEAQRLGLESYASDINPVAVLINKALIEIPPKFAGCPPVNPKSRKDKDLFKKTWRAAQGIAEDVRYYGNWMRDKAEKRIGYLYPKFEVTTQMEEERPDLQPYVGKKLNVIAWLWARTVRSPNPAFAHVHVPLASTFMLSKRPKNEAYVVPVLDGASYRFTVKLGKPTDAEAAKNGTKLSRGANFKCLMSGTPISGDYIMAEGRAGRMGARLMAIVAEGERGRVYLPPTEAMEAIARNAKPEWKPDVEFFQQALGFRVGNYGMTKWSDLFTGRQLVALATFSDLVLEAHELVKRDAVAAGLPDSPRLDNGGTGATAYAEAISSHSQIFLELTRWPRHSARRSSQSRCSCRIRRAGEDTATVTPSGRDHPPTIVSGRFSSPPSCDALRRSPSACGLALRST